MLIKWTNFIQFSSRGLKEMYGKKHKYTTPFTSLGILERSFPFIQKFPGFEENSKIITIEGGPCRDKKNFAKKLASHFSMKYFEPITDKNVYTDLRVDLRVFDPVLSERAKVYTLEKFYSNEKEFSNKTKICRLQWELYKKKFYQYIEAVKHVIKTGEGCVLVNSALYDYSYNFALYKGGYLTKEFFNYMNRLYKTTIPELLYPQLIMVLDGDVNKLIERDNFNEFEKKSHTFNKKYLTDLQEGTSDRNAHFKKYSEIINVDVNEPLENLEFEEICTNISNINLEPAVSPLIDDFKFYHWQGFNVHLAETVLLSYHDKQRLRAFFDENRAIDCPEFLQFGEELAQWINIYRRHPVLRENYQHGAITWDYIYDKFETIK